MKVYISGPMTGIEDMNEQAFRKRAKELKRFGVGTVVPHDIIGSDASRQEAMRTDLIHLLSCDAISPLDGCKNSRGAKVEMLVAAECGLSVVTVEGNVMKVEVQK